MNNIISNRKKVYDGFPTENLETSLADLVLLYNIEKNDYNDLIDATKNFLLKTMSLVYNKDFVWTDTFLEDNDELINNLPNKTPNGVLNPKNETAAEFMEIQKAVNNIFNNTGVYSHIKNSISRRWV